MNYSPNNSSIHLLRRHSSALVVIAVRGGRGAPVSLHRGAAGGPGMISGGMKPLWGCAAADGPSTTTEHPVSRLQAETESLIQSLQSHLSLTCTGVSREGAGPRWR